MNMYRIDETYDIESGVTSIDLGQLNSESSHEMVSPTSSTHTISCEDIEFQMYISLIKSNLETERTYNTELHIFDQFPSSLYTKLMKTFNSKILISHKVHRSQLTFRSQPKIRMYTWCNACACEVKRDAMQDHIMSMDPMIIHNHRVLMIEWLNGTGQLRDLRCACIESIEEKVWIAHMRLGMNKHIKMCWVVLKNNPLAIAVITPILVMIILIAMYPPSN